MFTIEPSVTHHPKYLNFREGGRARARQLRPQTQTTVLNLSFLRE